MLTTLRNDQHHLLLVCLGQLLHCICESISRVLENQLMIPGCPDGAVEMSCFESRADQQNSLETLGNAWHYVNIPLHYLYVALLLLCFILALGNRPAG